jgi:hypothetical protein
MAWGINEGSQKQIAGDVSGAAHDVSSGEHVQIIAKASGTLGALALETATNPGFAQPVAGTLGGCSTSLTISAASTNATSVKASAGTLYGVQVNNLNASVRYLKLYNKASAPTVGTDTPVKVIAIPAASSITVPIPPVGVAFATGIAFALTTGIANSDTGAVSANEHAVNIDYK